MVEALQHSWEKYHSNSIPETKGSDALETGIQMAALNDYIRWEQVDSLTARATMTWGDISASGVYSFNAEGDVVSFEAMRYYDRKSGATLENWYIQVEPDGYRTFNGIRIAAKMSVTWKLSEGDFNWLKLEVTDLQFNQLQVNT